jgi:hypothetical protein
MSGTQRRLLSVLFPVLLIGAIAGFCGVLFAEGSGRNIGNILFGVIVGTIAGLLGWAAWHFDLSDQD